MRGLEIVREIGFLDEALTGIMHHHERMDGKGYPMGLAADEIPEFARVIAVADAFDSMTSNRSYRARPGRGRGASANCARCPAASSTPRWSTRSSPALRREGWKLPEQAAAPLDHQTVTAQDHDDPRRRCG